MKYYCYYGIGSTYILYLSCFHALTYKLINKNNYSLDLLLSNMRNSIILSVITTPFIGYVIHKLIK